MFINGLSQWSAVMVAGGESLMVPPKVLTLLKHTRFLKDKLFQLVQQNYILCYFRSMGGSDHFAKCVEKEDSTILV